MWRSNLKLSLIICLSLLAGCTKPDKQETSDKSTFYLESASGEASLVPVHSMATWEVSPAVRVNFKVCLKDRVSQTALRSQLFSVEQIETGREFEATETLSDGCMGWSEDIPFNLLANRSTYVEVNRRILGKGIYSGSVMVRFAINPWAVGSNARDKGAVVIWLKPRQDSPIPSEKLKQDMMMGLSGDNSGAAEVHVPDVSVKTTREGNSENGYDINSTLVMSPQIRVRNADNEEVLLKFNRVAFDVTAYLVAVNAGPLQQDRVILTSSIGQLPTGKGKTEGGKLVVDVKSSIDKRVAGGNLELVLRLQPRGLRGNVKAFEGVFRLGDISKLHGDSFGYLRPECAEFPERCKFENALSAASNYNRLQQMIKDREILKGESYLFQNLALRFFKVLNGETATRRTVAYTASTCINDITGMRAIETRFNVQYLNDQGQPEGELKELITDQTGCLRWGSEISHKYYKPEQFFKKRVRISRGKAERTLTFYLNPWDDKFTFGFDDREFEPGYVDTLKISEVPSRFFLGDFGYHTVRFKYDIDPYMQLEVKKTVLMELQPKVLRYSGIVNARKMTEHVRDGIYLMKVGIEKDYLDPADPGRIIRNKPKSVRVELVDNLDIPAKQYVSTKTTLVRVTDGMIIQPVELSMHDLRLMRVRSNFLVQLQTVDEYKIQGENVLREIYHEDLQALKKERDERYRLNEEMLKTPDDESRKRIYEEIKERARQRSEYMKLAFKRLNEELDNNNRNLSNFEIDPVVLEPLKKALDINDFTTLKLSSSNDMDLNVFLEPDSGLEGRTFVGPVIFLSNAYKDSVRATDNLDEVKCGKIVGNVDNNTLQNKDSEDDFFLREEEDLFAESELEIRLNRDNPFYTYSEYFGSLRHLCDASVDQLIEVERQNKSEYRDYMDVVSSIYNFSLAYGLRYVSLKDVPLTKLDLKCKGSLKSCVRRTNELTIHRQEAERLAGGSIQGLTDDSFDSQESYQVCSILMNKVEERLRSENQGAITNLNSPIWYWSKGKDIYQSICENNLKVDRKLRVLDTGKDYIFMGGLQLNFNVGNSFSVSRGKSWSGGASFELFDWIGPSAAWASKAAGAMLRPLSLKMSVGTSMSSSEGTSVNQQTYLVSQIAKFNLHINKYEKCNVYRLSAKGVHQMNVTPIHVTRAPPPAVPESLLREMARGLVVCDGEVHSEPKNVDEIYFYFTQHFTEGDMLDQADLYNHPWLLALRGLRDFAVFTDVINAQEEVSMINYLNGGLPFQSVKRPLGWPLDKMSDTYRQITPSFPGFYTLLDDERLTSFPLENRLDQVDRDCNGEVAKPSDVCYKMQEMVKKTGFLAE